MDKHKQPEWSNKNAEMVNASKKCINQKNLWINKLKWHNNTKKGGWQDVKN